MGEMSQDASTGFIPEEELVQLAEAPDDVAAGADVVHSLSAIISASAVVSAAIQDGCPTTACTSRCS